MDAKATQQSHLHLQGVGKVEAITAAELVSGMRIMWNYGVCSDVVSIAPKGKQSLVVTTQYSDGKQYNSVMRKTHAVAGYWPVRA